VSKIAAFTPLIEMQLDEKKSAADLSGLAPMSRLSGRWRGRAFIAGGRAIVRQALSVPALVASDFNPGVKAQIRSAQAAGKAPKVAITATMQKLIVLANASLRNNRKWAPRPAWSKRIL
jgi:transposase